MAIDYLIWPNANPVQYACVLGDLTGFEGLYAMWEGKSFQADFPSDVGFSMNPEFPDNTILTDSLMNRYHLIVGSERLQNFFAERKIPLVECLRVAIRDHKGKRAADYYLINPLQSIDCLDRTASGAIVSRALNTQVISIKRLVLREEVLDPSRQLFRIAGYPQMRLIRRDLAGALLQAGFTGIKFRELDQQGK
jgi:hypothetical protein